MRVLFWQVLTIGFFRNEKKKQDTDKFAASETGVHLFAVALLSLLSSPLSFLLFPHPLFIDSLSCREYTATLSQQNIYAPNICRMKAAHNVLCALWSWISYEISMTENRQQKKRKRKTVWRTVSQERSRLMYVPQIGNNVCPDVFAQLLFSVPATK